MNSNVQSSFSVYAVEDPLLRNGLVHSEDEPYLSPVILESVNNELTITGTDSSSVFGKRFGIPLSFLLRQNLGSFLMLDKDATSDPHPSLWKPKNGHSYKHQTVTARVCTPCQTPILSLKWPYICKNPAVLSWFMHVP